MPAWLLDVQARRLVDVNDAALTLLGYSRQEFLDLPLADLAVPASKTKPRGTARPQSDLPAFPGVVRLNSKSGEATFLRLASVRSGAEGRLLDTVWATDVTDLVAERAGERQGQARTARAKPPAKSPEAFAGLLRALPSKLLVLAPGDFRILAATDAYLAALGLSAENVIGRLLFDVFPETPGSRTMADMRLSLQRVCDARAEDLMALMYFPRVRDDCDAPQVSDRFLAPGNWPVLAEDGSIAFIVHQIEDVTELVEAEGAPDLPREQLPAFVRSNDLKIANLRLQEQDANLRTAQRLLRLGIWRLNLASGELSLSANLKEILGLSNAAPSRLMAEYFKIVHPDDRRQMREASIDIAEGREKTCHFHHRILHADGMEIIVEGAGELSESRNGLVLTGIIRDVTERERVNDEMRLLSESVARINDLILITEAQPLSAPDGPKIIFANEAFVRRTGYTLQEIIGKTPRFLQGPLTQRAELDRIAAALGNWQPVRAELINYDKSGNPFWLELDIVPVEGAPGRWAHWIAVERDITARKSAESERILADDRFRLVTDATRDLIWDWDLSSGDFWYNSNYAQLLGEAAQDRRSTIPAWQSHILAEDIDEIVDSRRAFLDGADETMSARYRMITQKGEMRWMSERSLVLRDAAGRPVRMVASITDQTEQVELEDRVRQTERLEAVGRLTGGFAHDFNNLLTVILGNAETLVDRLSDDIQREMAQLILSASETGAELIQRLLAFSSRQPLVQKPHNLSSLTSQTTALIWQSLPENVTIRVSAPDDLWTCLIDGPQLQAAVMNLCVNARDAMPHGGSLTLELENFVLEDTGTDVHAGVGAGEFVVLSVRDTGTGMDAETVARVFEPFFTTKAPGEGSGLGLSMVYGFVKQTGGYVSISSVLGEGTQVSMYFPRWTGGDRPRPERAPEAVATFPQLHVLVVEDDVRIRGHVCRLIQELGLSVCEAGSSEEAIRQLENDRDIDVLFTDIILPGAMNGVELARAARALRPGLRVLFTSGYTRDALVQKGQVVDNTPILAKPYHREVLAAKLWEVVQAPRQPGD